MKIWTTTLTLLACSTCGWLHSQAPTPNYLTLDENNVSALVTDVGEHFMDMTLPQSAYELPKGSGNKAIYAAAFWFGGIDGGGQLHLAGQTYYSAADFYAGPYSTDSNFYFSPGYLALYGNSLWTVSKSEIDNHILNWATPGYVAPIGITEWPGNGDVSLGVAHELAPFVDVNWNGVYEPFLGDYPDIRGDRAVYSIVNDAAGIHHESNGEKLHIEIHVMFYQYSTNNYLNDLTFMNVRVFNRGSFNYSDFRTACYVDCDLGYFNDDFAGSDSTRNMAFTYNGDPYDEDNSGNNGYGADPPAIGIKTLNYPLNGALYYTNGGNVNMSDPNNANQFWNYMNGKWGDGTPLYFGGIGYGGYFGATGTPSNFMFSGDPLGINPPPTPWNWTETNIDGAGSANSVGDRRIVLNLEPIDLMSGDHVCYDYVIVYGPGTPGTYPSGISTLQARADSVQLFYDAQNFECQQVTVGLTEFEEDNEIGIYPNPTKGTIYLKVPTEYDGQIKITDTRGRIVWKGNYASTDKGKMELNEPSGMYIVQVKDRNRTRQAKFIIE